MAACNKPIRDGSKQAKNETEQTDSAKEEEFKDESLGVKYSLLDKWKSKEENVFGIGQRQYENIVGGFTYSFISTETAEKLKKLDKEAETIPETDNAQMEKIQPEYMNAFKEEKNYVAL